MKWVGGAHGQGSCTGIELVYRHVNVGKCARQNERVGGYTKV